MPIATLNYNYLWRAIIDFRQFTVPIGTILENSKIPPNKWVLGFRLMA
jgi:hypothetical protein